MFTGNITVSVTVLATLLFLASVVDDSSASSASLRGIVKDTSGAPLKGIFVQARNLKTDSTTSVPSDQQGRYWFDSLPSGDYDVMTQAVGFSSERRRGLKLEERQSPSVDFTLKSRPIQWTELSWVDYRDKLPDRAGKEEAIATCSACHGFRWHSLHPKDSDGWRQTLHWMRKEWSYFLGPEGVPEGGEIRLTDEKIEKIASYLASVFGSEGDLPPHPDVHRRQYGDESLNIVFVDFDMPTRRAFPWSGYPDGKGHIWIPQYNSNQIARLNPKTGEIQEFKVPHAGRAAVHSAVPAPDGTVWATEASTAYKIARFDPRTQTFTEFRDPGKGVGIRTKHTNVIDPQGRVWSSGGTFITRFDPRAQKFDHFGDVPRHWDSYGIAADKMGNIYYTRLAENRFGRVDGKTGKVTEWDAPTPNAGPRRIHVDSKGIVWFAEFFAGKACRFDPKTETFKEYTLPGPAPRPYGFGIDGDDYIWYYAWGQSEIGRLDPNTGKVVQYPIPYIDPTMRDLFWDSAERRMWFGAPPANKVGYFYLRAVQ